MLVCVAFFSISNWSMCIFIARMRSFGLRKTKTKKIKKKMMATSNGRLHPIHYQNIFLSFVQKNYKRFSHSVAQWDETEQQQHQQKYDKSSPFMCEKIYYYFYWDQAFSCAGLTWFQHTLGQAMCVPFFLSSTLLVGDCWCFLSVFFFRCELSKWDTSTAGINWHILQYTHTQQQQHYESIYW